ncbi:hypothetical protein SAMN05444682_10861 [Parapedobacter indicus]|uniref:Uncharacterized protein n=1 Tax=Parapedobacter indicus TaxID=1477437 RepID=A0A1I3PI90_9SPHI|nr:hypothetical protein CLV26_10861 [Parapedobacter indicus]SFJ21384.1 hypothetical protein SAMN05444682_10861 [Parapedobacter indicus]
MVFLKTNSRPDQVQMYHTDNTLHRVKRYHPSVQFSNHRPTEGKRGIPSGDASFNNTIRQMPDYLFGEYFATWC